MTTPRALSTLRIHTGVSSRRPQLRSTAATVAAVTVPTRNGHGNGLCIYLPAYLPGWLVLVTIKKYRVRYSLVRPWYLNTNYAPAAIPICCGQLPSLMRKTRSSCAEALCLSRRKPSEICQVGGSSRRVACAVGDRSTRRLISECTDTCRSPCIWLWTGVRTTSYAVQYLCVPGY